ncbi:carbohydrate kinase family protein [Lachnoclostridium phytofermentans]|uniref:PfkB domain protein n=1 Tax=Lachnoclostridium phytofermentans (strain ATCC 700394 / DSM 18823 / ISDg) TaxID=357809 RepID=A9KM69_LACP7|nr:carbohydrate kinase family protein [Lachnoclostridium phytofermentans]ABX41412.1 PfkB domain protein [Lachnoclostridium phytofermentans ISDg]
MFCEKEPYILVFGVSIYDIIGFTNQSFKPNDSNPGKVRISFGGVCRNIAENLARVGVNTKFISVVGDDEKGRSLLEHANKMQLDMKDSLIVKGESTPTYMAILNEEGELEAGIVDMKVTEYITKEFIDSKAELFEQAEYVVLDADNPPLLEYVLKKFYGKTKFIMDPVSSTKAKSVKHLIPYLHTIKPNRIEAEILCGFPIKDMKDLRKAGKYFLDQGLQKVFISLDMQGVYYNDRESEGLLKTDKVSVVNVTGAGDSCVAGLGFGYMKGLDTQDTLKIAIAMSVITIAHEDTIHPDMSYDLVTSSIKSITWIEENIL